VLTTRCSSAFALIASCWVVVCAQTPGVVPFPSPSERAAKTDRTPPPLFPAQQIWTLALNNLLTASAAYDDARAFFAIEGDRLVAYDLMSGEQQWLVEAKSHGAPATGDGLVFIVEDANLTALKAEDGSVAWQVPFEPAPNSAPVWDVGWLVAATSDGQVAAFRAKDGELIWKRDVHSPAHGRPALAADRVYVPTRDGRVVALRVETGEPVWERRLGGMPADLLALDDRVFTGASDNFFYCLLAKNGVVDWRWRTGGDIVGAPIAHEGRVYFVALDNVLRAMSQKTGAQLWMRPLPLRPVWGPTAAGSTVIVAGLSNAVRGFAMKDGAPAGELTTDAEVTMQPHAFDDPVLHRPMVVVVTRDIAKGAAAALHARSFEPPMSPVAPLPNLVQIAPPAPTTLTPRDH
jgi:outer membrane protein assembly factor BamB